MKKSTLLFVLLFAFFVNCDTSAICRYITDVVVLVESKSSSPDGAKTFHLHQDTVINFVHRLPMREAGIRTTIIQFNRVQMKIEGIFPSNISSFQRQDKFEFLNSIAQMKPLDGADDGQKSGNLLGALKITADLVIPNLLGGRDVDASTNFKKYSEIVIIVILSAFFSKPNLQELATTYQTLDEHGATTYVVAYNMDGHPSDSILPVVASKPEFLILPEINQAETTAGHLSDVLHVCWQRGVCWPNNPCPHGCECVQSSNAEAGYECQASGNHWLGKNCNEPSPLLLCRPDRMEIRIPEDYLPKNHKPDEEIVFIGKKYRWRYSSTRPSRCLGRIISSPEQDNGILKSLSSLFLTKGYYYYIKSDVIKNDCLSTIHFDGFNKTVKIENVVFQSRPFLPPGVNLNFPLLRIRCNYRGHYEPNIGLTLIETTGKSMSYFDSTKGSFSLPFMQMKSGQRSHLTEPQTMKEWRKMNPFGDRDRYSEKIFRNKENKNQLQPEILVVKDTADSKIKFSNDLSEGRSAIPSNRDSLIERLIQIAMASDCHGGPYEKNDPCNPLNFITNAATDAPTTEVASTTTEATEASTTTEATEASTTTEATVASTTTEATEASTTTEATEASTTTEATVAATTTEATVASTTTEATEASTTTEATVASTTTEATEVSTTTDSTVASTTTEATVMASTDEKTTWVVTSTIVATPEKTSTIMTTQDTSTSIISALETSHALQTSEQSTTLAVTTFEPTTFQPTTAFELHLKITLYYDEGMQWPVAAGASLIGSKLFAAITFTEGQSSPFGFCPVIRDCWLSHYWRRDNGTVDDLVEQIIDEGCPMSNNFASVWIMNNGGTSISLFSYHVFHWREHKYHGSISRVNCTARVCDCSVESCQQFC